MTSDAGTQAVPDTAHHEGKPDSTQEGQVSYCRFWWDNSDVYVYGSDRGIECCGCILHEYPNGFTADGPVEMIEHLMRHRAGGHVVPEYALEALREEAGIPLEHAELRKEQLP